MFHLSQLLQCSFIVSSCLKRILCECLLITQSVELLEFDLCDVLMVKQIIVSDVFIVFMVNYCYTHECI